MGSTPSKQATPERHPRATISLPIGSGPAAPAAKDVAFGPVGPWDTGASEPVTKEPFLRLPPGRTEKVTLLIVGAGARGRTYAGFARDRPDLVQVVGVAEPVKLRREQMAKDYDIPDDRCFDDWHDAAAKPRFADIVCICTQDSMHRDPAIAFARLGYHMLLEKPMATTEEDCIAIAEAVDASGVMCAVGHILRYSPYSARMKELIDAGAIGELVSVQHMEPIGYWHFAHSYVRGNWRNEALSSPSLLAKCCHDIDWLLYIIARPVQRVSSFGSLMHFRREDAPTGAAARCLQCPAAVESTCAYSARKIYLQRVQQGHLGWPVSMITDLPSEETVTAALETGPYGRCVYHCDNDVMSSQLVNLAFDNGASASFTMMAFTHEVGVRSTRIFGTKGQLVLSKRRLMLHDFLTGTARDVSPNLAVIQHTSLRAHTFGDYYLMRGLLEAVMHADPSRIRSNVWDSLRGHQVVFAAERSRVTGTTVRFASPRRKPGSQHERGSSSNAKGNREARSAKGSERGSKDGRKYVDG